MATRSIQLLWISSLIFNITLISMASAGELSIQTNFWKSDDATISFSPEKQLWILATKKLSAELGFDTSGFFRLLSLTDRLNKWTWKIPTRTSPPELNCIIDGNSYSLTRKPIQGIQSFFPYNTFSVSKASNKSLTLTLFFASDELTLQLFYAIYPNSAIIERWAELKNKSGIAKTITQFDSVNLNFATDANRMKVYSITGLSQHLPYNEHILHPSFIVQENIVDEQNTDTLEIYSGGRSSERNLVWLAIQPDNAKGSSGALNSTIEGLFAGIEWSGESRFVCKKINDGFTFSAGLVNFEQVLNKGTRIITPKAFFGVYSGSLDEASKITHQFCRTYLTPKVPKEFPWTMYNTWFSYGIDQNEEWMKKEIDNAVALGLDGFYLDAGWYQLSPRPAETGNFDFSPGVGIWKENKEKYPSGIRALSDYCHKKGLKFGIWVEPERVDARARNLESDPLTDIMLAKHDTQPISGDGNKTMLLCLGNLEAREWLKRQLGYVIETYKIDWLKWDNNSWGICNRTDHGHQAGDGNYSQIQGLYEVLDYLREKYPNLIIENCASGGNRMDFGMIQRTHIFWVHDDSYTNYVCRYHHYGTAYAFPPEYLNSWIIQDGDLSRALGQNKTISKQMLAYIFRSRFLGACGISLRTLDWSPELKQQVKESIAEYKRFRKYLEGEFYHLTPQTIIYNQTWEPPKSWEAFQYKLKKESIIFYYREDTENNEQIIYPQGIDTKKVYEIIFIDTNEKITITGMQLIKKGLSLKLNERFSSGIAILNVKVQMSNKIIGH